MTIEDLMAWAASTAVADIESVKRQITEYGAIDLEMMGMGLLEASKLDPAPLIHDGVRNHEVQIGMEMACIHYLLGKISRAVSAIAAGQLPSKDTRKDIRVYALMWEHVVEFGSWGIDEKPMEVVDGE
jgi:hypothetical protein